MTISADYVPNIDLGNGATRTFAVNFPFGAAADLAVSLYDTVANVDVTPAPVLNGGATYDYTVTGTPNPDTGIYPSGSVTFNSAPLSSYKVVRERATPQRQSLSLTNNGPFPAKSVEGALDREEMQLQERDEQLTRTVLAPAADGGGSMELQPLGVRAGFVAAFDAVTGALIATTTTITDLAAGVAAATVQAAAAAASAVLAAASATLASNWAQLTGAFVTSTSQSAKEWAVGVYQRGAAGFGSAKDWAILLATTVDNADYSAKEYAIGSTVAAGSSKVWAVAAAASATAAAAVVGNQGRNRLTNGDWRINQRAYVSAATLASGKYGHDRWKAGGSGGNYSFTQLKSDTTITIAASKSLIQVVEDADVEGGSYILSWTGTATARVGINSATPSGNFAVSPITITGQTAGTTMAVEFTGANAAGTSAVATNTGTMGKAQFEPGSIATPFERLDYQVQLARCLRYAFRMAIPADTGFAAGAAFSTTAIVGVMAWPLPMRAAPTITFGGSLPRFLTTGVAGSSTAVVSTAVSAYAGEVSLTVGGSPAITAGWGGWLRGAADGTTTILGEAEL